MEVKVKVINVVVVVVKQEQQSQSQYSSSGPPSSFYDKQTTARDICRTIAQALRLKEQQVTPICLRKTEPKLCQP